MNHSNDATFVKQYHMWGAKNGVTTATVHDAFVANAADLLEAKNNLRNIYAEAVKKESIKATLDEMLKRGFPRELYDKYLEEAIAIGLIPVPGRSVVGGRVLREKDILKYEDVLEEIPEGFSENRSWYGIGG